MKNKAIILLGVLSATVLLNGCGTDNKNSDRIVQYFEKDLYTQSVNVLKPVENDNTTSDNKKDEHSNGYDETLAEITLVGEDNSIAYDIIDGADVKYKGILYKNLYTNVNSLNTNYDKNTLINFIIKTYEAKSSTIYTDAYSDISEGEGSDIEAFTLDDMLSDSTEYQEVKHKYGESASWLLKLIDSETRREVQMYGATSYILVTADGISKEIDMNSYDSGVNNNDAPVNADDTAVNADDTITESTETAEESTETAEEIRETADVDSEVEEDSGVESTGNTEEATESSEVTVE